MANTMKEKVLMYGGIIVGGALILSFLLKYIILPRVSDWADENFPKPVYGPHARHDDVEQQHREADRVVSFRGNVVLSEVRGIEQVVNFTAVFYCKWIEKTLIDEHSPVISYERIAGEELPWIPLFLYNNLIEAEEITSSFFLRRSDGTILWTTELSLKIRENLELQEFPYDRQLFKLSVCTDTKFQLWLCDLDQDANLPLIFRRQYPLIAGSLSTAWQMEKLNIKNYYSEAHGINGLQFEIFCCRNPGFYVINFGVVNFVIIILSLTTRAVDPSDFANRSQITLTLLLTLVAFKFVINSYVTQTNYLTYLDYYILFSLLILACVILENYLISFQLSSSSASQYQQQQTKQQETIFYGCIFTIWIVLHIFIVIGTINHWFYPSWSFVIERDAIDGQFAYADNYGETTDIMTPDASRPTPSYTSSRSQSFIALFQSKNHSQKDLLESYRGLPVNNNNNNLNNNSYNDFQQQHHQKQQLQQLQNLHSSAPRNMQPVPSFYNMNNNSNNMNRGNQLRTRGLGHIGGSISKVPPLSKYPNGAAGISQMNILEDTSMAKM